jgi:SAM-dependent methyltransferase
MTAFNETTIRDTLKAIPGLKPTVRFSRKVLQKFDPPHLRLREILAKTYLRGEGVEIGALHIPVKVSRGVRVRYVDEMSNDALRQEYPWTKDWPLVHVDIIDDGESLKSVANNSQDFVIANHLLEHMENPIWTLQRFLEVIKPGGMLYHAVPDKRFGFDSERQLTSIEHIIRDFQEGPSWSRQDHFREFAKLVIEGKVFMPPDRNPGQRVYKAPDVEAEAQRLMRIDYSIHFHVWTHQTFLELLMRLKTMLPFSIEAYVFNASSSESIAILRKD